MSEITLTPIEAVCLSSCLLGRPSLALLTDSALCYSCVAYRTRPQIQQKERAPKRSA